MGDGIVGDIADYAIAHYEDMLALYGVESGLRQARKHLGWYLDRHADGVPAELCRTILSSFKPAQVIAALRGALTSPWQTEAARSAA
jgi:tRNA-dihydrouridine synthase